MGKYTKQFVEENAFFIKPGKRRSISFNEQCKRCRHECKQSFRADVVTCKHYELKGK